MSTVKVSTTVANRIARRRKKKEEDPRKPGQVHPRLRDEFFTADYAKLFEEEGERLYKEILDSVKGKLSELFEGSVARLTETLKHKKGVDGLKDNAQFFAPWIKGLVDDVRTLGMEEIVDSLETLARDHSVKVVDESLLEAPVPDLLPESEGVEEDEPLPDEMAIPEAVETPEIPELSAGDVESLLKGEDVLAPAPATPSPVAPAVPPPEGAAPGAPVAPLVPAPQPAVAANTIKDVRRQLLERRQYRKIVSEASSEDLLRAADANMKILEDDNA